MANLRLPMDTIGKSQPQLAVFRCSILVTSRSWMKKTTAPKDIQEFGERNVLAKAGNYCS